MRPPLLPPELPQLPRLVKYAWALGVSLLVVLSVSLDPSCRWLPVVRHALQHLLHLSQEQSTQDLPVCAPREPVPQLQRLNDPGLAQADPR